MARQLDLVLLVDTTGSMGQYLYSAQSNINKIVNTITNSEKIDLRFAIVEYKDHQPNQQQFALKKYDWMNDIKDIQNAINQLSAYGGGMDGPESVTCAFDCAVNLGYRGYAAKVIIWIADAPPHGFNIQYDGYPNGCPCGIDFQEVVLKAIKNDIQIYSVACEPIRPIYRHFRDLMRAVAMMTGGQFIALNSADCLADVIIGGSLEEVGMNFVIQKIENDLNNTESFKTKTKNEQEKEIRKAIAEYFKENSTLKQIKINSIFKGELPEIPKIFFTATTFKELVDVLKTREPNVYKFKDSFKIKEYIPYPQPFWDKNGLNEYQRKTQNLWSNINTKHIKMEMCDDDEYQNYYGIGNTPSENINIPKEIPEDFKEGEIVRIKETSVGVEHQNKIFERLKKRLEQQ
ncbi:hypothetical protein ENUP19_0134G0011 [Entamoeba nuttalli]|uniref:Elongation factor-2 kinase, putative n=2 Tax=Entamoeba nuttalli TaxID=412467 RepID=K2GF37_ENTNP|nr:elongation factor-2 kinase, putative [Entamoeba nuttalli P19]EKE41231.1 elongation factor-2 kinase, putative [Entamoeba nuttalli P19]|eukprot:XP_008856431.1 elongation factor-2 kinase, putative [Entamoeba nuttalli P19]